MRAAVLSLCLCVVAMLTTAARADDDNLRAAKRHYAKGDKLFALGKFEQALVEFEAAYEAKPLPKLLFNIGQAHRNLDHYDQAIFAFRKYLREVPDADNREAVEKLIDDLEAKRGGRGRARRAPPGRPPRARARAGPAARAPRPRQTDLHSLVVLGRPGGRRRGRRGGLPAPARRPTLDRSRQRRL
jgi:tetratricopeptide (TPR) repeat protein